jgi:hypothetical protein
VPLQAPALPNSPALRASSTFTDKRQVKIRSDSCRAYLRAYLENAPGPRPGFRVDAAAATWKSRESRK